MPPASPIVLVCHSHNFLLCGHPSPLLGIKVDTYIGPVLRWLYTSKSHSPCHPAADHVPCRPDGCITPCAGRFGFQREMNALKTLKSGEDTEDSTNVNALLHGTHEIELRLQQINRWFRLWRKDVRDGWVTLGRFRVSCPSRLCSAADKQVVFAVERSHMDRAHVIGLRG